MSFALDLLVPASSDQLLLIIFFNKTSCPNKEVNRTEPFPSPRAPCKRASLSRRRISTIFDKPFITEANNRFDVVEGREENQLKIASF